MGWHPASPRTKESPSEGERARALDERRLHLLVPAPAGVVSASMATAVTVVPTRGVRPVRRISYTGLRTATPRWAVPAAGAASQCARHAGRVGHVDVFVPMVAARHLELGCEPSTPQARGKTKQKPPGPHNTRGPPQPCDLWSTGWKQAARPAMRLNPSLHERRGHAQSPS